jgi:hypothetical protein
MNILRWLVVAATAVPVIVATGHAHTLANTVVSVATTHPGIVDVTIDAEADPLIAKLEILAGVSPSGATTTAERRRRIESLEAALRAHIDMRAAATSLTLALRDVTVDATAQTVIRLTAGVPPGSATVTWRNTFIFGAYQLVIDNGGADDRAEWLQGPQTSTPIALTGRSGDSDSIAERVAQRRVSHGLAMGVLVVFMIFRRRAGLPRASSRGHRVAGG